MNTFSCWPSWSSDHCVVFRICICQKTEKEKNCYDRKKYDKCGTVLLHLFNVTFFNKTIPICLHFNSISPILCPCHCVFVKSLLILASLNSQQHWKKQSLQKTAYSVLFFCLQRAGNTFLWVRAKTYSFCTIHVFEKAEKQGSYEAVSERTMKTYDGPIELSGELSVSLWHHGRLTSETF